jgi:putative transposase
MKRKRHTPEEIIKKLRQAGVLLAGGKNVEEVCRALGTSVATYQRWKSQYGGVKKDALKRLRELEKENARLKRAIADLTLDKAILKEIAEGKW